ncbi:energy transducer TonB [Rhodospirillum centenum]|uniref:energy transducer TonB n=1 Tax=Rhodospirillum centenum TaxID=34018 RepID=UPI0002E062C7|nr:energy transducer TonB [Rhodospirillum centenum]
MPLLAAATPAPLSPDPAARRARITRRALTLSAAAHLLGLGLLAGLAADPQRRAPLEETAVEVLVRPAGGEPSRAALRRAAAAALATVTGMPPATALDGTETAAGPETPQGLPHLAWPELPVRIAPPRLTAQATQALRAPDAPPPLPAPEPVDLESFIPRVPAGREASPSPARARPDNPTPAYPEAARRQGLQGKVLLRVTVGPSGEPVQVSLVESSGWALLDDAALETVKGWRFDPAHRDGLPVAAVVEVPVAFSLDQP